MKSWFRFVRLAVPALALLACAAPARAQDPTRVQDEIARTDMRIERAEELLTRAPNREAQPYLDNAKLMQSRAKSAFAARQPGIALRLTLQARGAADRAISMVQGLPEPERVSAQLERTREIIERTRDRIADCSFDRARFLLQVATAMEQRAEDAAHDERYLAALQLTMSARERALRALRLCNRDDNARDTAERALRRTDEILARAQDAVSAHGDEPARQALARAAGLQAEARQEFLADRFEPCLRLTQSARTLAQRAIRRSGGSF
jgi:hypothetical protein